jgi:hypothetical protein
MEHLVMAVFHILARSLVLDLGLDRDIPDLEEHLEKDPRILDQDPGTDLDRRDWKQDPVMVFDHIAVHTEAQESLLDMDLLFEDPQHIHFRIPAVDLCTLLTSLHQQPFLQPYHQGPFQEESVHDVVVLLVHNRLCHLEDNLLVRLSVHIAHLVHPLASRFHTVVEIEGRKDIFSPPEIQRPRKAAKDDQTHLELLHTRLSLALGQSHLFLLDDICRDCCH